MRSAEGISVLGIKRGEEKFIGSPDGNSKVKKGDVVVTPPLVNLEKRKMGRAGERDPSKAVNDQEGIKLKQEEEE